MQRNNFHPHVCDYAAGTVRFGRKVRVACGFSAATKIDFSQHEVKVSLW